LSHIRVGRPLTYSTTKWDTNSRF